MTIMPVIEWVEVTDAEMLRKVGCPWKTKTLRKLHSLKKYPGLFSKPAGKIMLHVPTLHKLLEDNREKEG